MWKLLTTNEKVLFFSFYLDSYLFFRPEKNKNYSFYENKGQIINQNGNPNPDVKYLLNSPGLNVQIKEHGFSYDVYETERKELKRQKVNR